MDPHVHTPATLIGIGRLRAALTSAVGRPVSVPATVATACGQRRPVADTSSRPESVTCLACREEAGRRHREWAAELERISHVPGVAADPWVLAEAARQAELARRYAQPL